MKTIWINDKSENIYAEFRHSFVWNGEKTQLRITASRNYAAFVNGSFVSNAQFADVPEYKAVDEIDITALLCEGENTLSVLAYHWDSDFATAKVMPAALAFEVEENGKLLANSGAETKVRKAVGYYPLDVKVTPQIGYAYGYDFCEAEGEWESAVYVSTDFTYVKRPNKRLVIKEPAEAVISAQGCFKYNGGTACAEKCMRAWLTTLRFSDMTRESRLSADKLTEPVTFKASGGDGVFVIVDLGCERAGYLALELNVPVDCSAALTWGEHLADLRVRSEIGGRSFATELRLKKGKNKLDEYLHRLGARYLCIFVESNELTVHRLTVREAVYPFVRVERHFEDRLVEKIYDTAVRTLELSAHEHYEDCPWREQALYGMDSRNQMLFGYSAFREYELPRAVLTLLRRTARKSGLIELCAPSVAPIVIPSFTLYALLAFVENAEADYNEEFVREYMPYAESTLDFFTKRAGEHGLSAFVESEYWNFHEWSDGLDGGEIFRDHAIEPYSDGPLTALAIIVLRKLSVLEDKLGNREMAEKHRLMAVKLASSLESFYDSRTGLYFSFVRDGKPYGLHAYTQALYLLTDMLPAEHRAAMLEELKHAQHTVKMTFASLQMKYAAILNADNDADYCLNEACEIFGKMLYSGATSFYETENGEADFDDAGSLCHGWSAVPCWLFDKLELYKK